MNEEISYHAFRSIIGDDTEVVVTFDYHPSEPRTSLDPGCAASVDLCEVLVSGDDIIRELSEKTLSRFEEEAFSWRWSPQSELDYKVTGKGNLLYKKHGYRYTLWFSNPDIAMEHIA